MITRLWIWWRGSYGLVNPTRWFDNPAYEALGKISDQWLLEYQRERR